MNTLVIDASIAIKWVVEEDGTADALTLRRHAKLIAPDLLAAECANILWKKVRRNELSKDEAFLAARLLQAADLDLLPTRSLLETATRSAVAPVRMAASVWFGASGLRLPAAPDAAFRQSPAPAFRESASPADPAVARCCRSAASTAPNRSGT